MKIYLYLEANSNPFIDSVNNAMIDYLKTTKHQLTVIPFKNFKEEDELDCDLVIFFGIYSRKAPHLTYHKKILYHQLKKENKGLLILEKGFIKRGKYYSVGWNSNVGYGYYHNEKMPDDRLKQLKVSFKPNIQNKKGYILICGQIPHDTQLQHLGPEEYTQRIQAAADQIKSKTQRKIVFRNHPKLAKRKQSLKITGVEVSKTLDLADDLKNCYAVVGFNSNSLLESMVAGYPVFVLDRGSLIYEISNQDLDQIKSPTWPTESEKYQVFCDIAYTQWNEDEVRKGLAFEHIIKGYDEARKRLGSERNFNLELEE